MFFLFCLSWMSAYDLEAINNLRCWVTNYPPEWREIKRMFKEHQALNESTFQQEDVGYAAEKNHPAANQWDMHLTHISVHLNYN